MRAPTTDHRSTAADHRSANEAVPAPAVRPYRAGATHSDSDKRMGRSLKETYGTRNRQGHVTRTRRYDPGCTAIWRGSPQFEDAVSKCIDISSESGTGGSPGS